MGHTAMQYDSFSWDIFIFWISCCGKLVCQCFWDNLSVKWQRVYVLLIHTVLYYGATGNMLWLVNLEVCVDQWEPVQGPIQSHQHYPEGW